MKKKIVLISIMIAGAMLAFYSCTKENQTIEQGQQASTLVEGPELTPTDIKVNNLINGFRDKVAYHLENPGLKSGESIAADSVLWFLEATINYLHCFPNEYYGEKQTDELTLVIPKNENGQVDMDLLSQKYDEMKTSVSTIYHNSGFESKGLVLVDIAETSQTADNIELNVQVVTGNGKNEDPVPTNGPFVEGDDWWYGEDYGHCDDHSILEDATNHLYDAVEAFVPDPGGSYFFIDEITFTVYGGDTDIRRPYDNLNNDYDYYLYAAVEGDEGLPFTEQETLCLGYNEMNGYFNLMKTLIFDKLPNEYLPEKYGIWGHSIETFHWLDDGKVEEEEITKYFHFGHFTYGRKVGYALGEQPTEL